jgi:phosphoribosylamine--glycine ligase
VKRFLFISKLGDGIPLAQRIVSDGNSVLFYINDKPYMDAGEGLIDKPPIREPMISDEGVVEETILKQLLAFKPDCIVFDLVGKGYGVLADKLRKEGYPCIGGSAWQDQIELDRMYGNKIMKTYGISTPKTTSFTSYKDAIRFVEETNKPYVYKPDNNQGTITTYVAKGADDLIGMLEFYADEIKEKFELQEVVDGVEVSSEVWFNGKEVLNINHTMEDKALMDGGVGPKTGSMGSVVWNGNKESRLYKEGIGKCVDALKRLSYRGPIDLNAIVNKDKLYGLEFTARFGYDAIFTWSELLKMRLSDLLLGCADGTLKAIPTKGAMSIGVTFCVLPFPASVGIEDTRKMCEDKLIQGISPEAMKHIWFYDVKKVGDRYACAGVNGNIGVVTARSDESNDTEGMIREARRRAYRTIHNLVIPDVMYRSDMGERGIKDISTLRKWGWIS